MSSWSCFHITINIDIGFRIANNPRIPTISLVRFSENESKDEIAHVESYIVVIVHFGLTIFTNHKHDNVGPHVTSVEHDIGENIVLCIQLNEAFTSDELFGTVIAIVRN